MDRLGKSFLCPPQSRKSVRKVALLNLHGKVPERLLKVLDRRVIQSAQRSPCLQAPDNEPKHHEVGCGSEDAFRTVGHGTKDLRHTPGILPVPEQVAPPFDDCLGKGVEEPPARQDHGLRFGHPLLPGIVKCRQFRANGKVGPRMARKVADHGFGEFGPVTGNCQRQFQHDRFARLGIRRQPVSTVNLLLVEDHLDPPSDDPVVVPGGKGRFHAAPLAARHRSGKLYFRHEIRLGFQGPFPTARTVDPDLAILADAEALRWIACRRHVLGPARHGFVQRQVSDTSVKTDRHEAAFGNRERGLRDVIEIEVGSPGIVRRLDPSLPGGLQGQCLLVKHDLAQGADLQERPEQKPDRKAEKRDIAKPEQVKPGKPEVRLYRPSLIQASCHASDMSLPDCL